MVSQVDAGQNGLRVPDWCSPQVDTGDRRGDHHASIAWKQLEAGAIGVTCAKVSEAEVMAASGIRDILVANTMVGPYRLERVASLCRSADLTTLQHDQFYGCRNDRLEVIWPILGRGKLQ